jgi:hypothetical protein
VAARYVFEARERRDRAVASGARWTDRSGFAFLAFFAFDSRFAFFAFGSRFAFFAFGSLLAFFAFFFAILISPLNDMILGIP